MLPAKSNILPARNYTVQTKVNIVQTKIHILPAKIANIDILPAKINIEIFVLVERLGLNFQTMGWFESRKPWFLDAWCHGKSCKFVRWFSSIIYSEVIARSTQINLGDFSGFHPQKWQGVNLSWATGARLDWGSLKNLRCWENDTQQSSKTEKNIGKSSGNHPLGKSPDFSEDFIHWGGRQQKKTTIRISIISNKWSIVVDVVVWVYVLFVLGRAPCIFQKEWTAP